MGAIITVLGYILIGRDVISWGLPIWAWQAIGAAIFFVSVIAIIYGHQNAITFKPRLSNDPTKQKIISESSPKQERNVGQQNKTRVIEAKPPTPEAIVTSEQISELIPGILTPQFYTPKDDAIFHLKIMGRDNSSALSVLRGVEGCPIQYPIRLFNTRPIVVEVISYTIKIFLNEIPVQVVVWNNPNNETSNGMSMGHPLYLRADDITTLNVPIVLAQMQGILPQSNPEWSATGELRFQSDKDVAFKRFDFKNDRYVLLESDWDYLRKNALPK